MRENQLALDLQEQEFEPEFVLEYDALADGTDEEEEVEPSLDLDDPDDSENEEPEDEEEEFDDEDDDLDYGGNDVEEIAADDEPLQDDAF